MLFVPAGCAIALFLAVGQHMYSEFEREKKYEAQYGENWREVYEKEHGSIAGSRGKMVVGVGSIIVVCGLAVLIYKVIMPEGPIKSRRRRR